MSYKTTNVPFEATLQVALEFLKGLGTVRSLSVYMLADRYLLSSYEPDNFVQELKSIGFSVNWYDQYSVEAFKADYQATVLLSKLPAPTEQDTTLSSRAIESFKEAEDRNRLINERWSLSDTAPAKLDLEKLGTSIEEVRSHMRRILGRAPSLLTLDKKLAWSSGASVGVSRQWSSGETKSEFGVTITPKLAKALSSYWGRLSPLINQRDGWVLVPGNLVSTVRKNIETDRTVAGEADINALYQRAVGDIFRSRLLPYGINLRDQSLAHKMCARCILDQSATVDLKNASNSVIYLPAIQALPEDWAELIEVLRSPYGTFSNRSDVLAGKAEWFEYSMLSSMGNGFTFELESLLFFVLCQLSGAEDYEINVYGDDIILPQRCVPRLTALLDVFGLVMNKEKSFVTGTFFESCGLYSFHGVDVTPLKIKDLLNGNKDGIILANKIRWFAHLLNNYNGCAKRCLPAWQMCIRRLSSNVLKQCRGPVGSGLLLYMNRAELLNAPYSRKRGALVLHQLVPNVHTGHAEWTGLLPYRLYQISGSLLADEVCYDLTQFGRLDLQKTNRGNVIKTWQKGFVIAPLFLEGSNWYDLGKWE